MNPRERRLIAYCINNKLFYSAIPLLEDEEYLVKKQEISAVYGEFESICKSYEDKNPEKSDFIETLAWAKLNAGFYNELSDVENIVQPLINSTRLSYKWKKDIFDRYSAYRTKNGDKLTLSPPCK